VREKLAVMAGAEGRHQVDLDAVDSPAVRLQTEVALWQSPAMQAIWEVLQQAAGVDVTVLISGETGTGKDLAARAIHALSARHDRPLVRVNCAAVPRELLESELFGYERGVFTGAHQTRIGTFESANTGTVFLDEIGDLHPALQAKLLHVLQDGTFSRVGGRSTLKADVRILAATNTDLEPAVADGRFRDDLFYRLNVIHVSLPPLRERVEEIPMLIDYFVGRYAKLYKREGFQPSPVGMARLMEYRYPGNIRELENIVKRMIVLGDPSVGLTHLGPGPASTIRSPSESPVGTRRPDRIPGVSLKLIAKEAAQAAERALMQRVLAETHWNRTQAARILKISYRALLYKIKDAGLKRVPATPGSLG
jgi:two-component system, NtrC family, response regulator AtoC